MVSDQSISLCQSDFVLLHLGFRRPLPKIVRMSLAINFEVVVVLPHEREMLSFGPHALRAAKFQRVSDLLERKSVDHRETHFLNCELLLRPKLPTARLFVLTSLNFTLRGSTTAKV